MYMKLTRTDGLRRELEGDFEYDEVAVYFKHITKDSEGKVIDLIVPWNVIAEIEVRREIAVEDK